MGAAESSGCQPGLPWKWYQHKGIPQWQISPSLQTEPISVLQAPVQTLFCMGLDIVSDREYPGPDPRRSREAANRAR